MRVFYMRPLFLSCFLFLTFSVIGYFLPEEYKLWLIAALFFLGVTVILFKVLIKKPSSLSILCIIMSVVMSSLALVSSYMFFNVKLDSVAKYQEERHVIEGMVISEDYKSTSFSAFEVVVTKIDGEPTYHKADLSCEYFSVLSQGDSFSAKVDGVDFEDTAKDFSEKNYKHSDGIFINYVSYNENDVDKIASSYVHPKIYFKLLNQKVKSVFSDGLDEETRNMCSAIFLGNKSDLSSTVRRDFTRAGAAHILALSGLHMSIIMGCLLFILKGFRLNRKLIAVVLSVIAVFYLFLTGFQISAARSVIMLLCVYIGWIFGGYTDSLTSLIISATALMLIFPGSVLDAGYWMSFAATLGILVYMEPLTEEVKRLLSEHNVPKFLARCLIKLSGVLTVAIFAAIPLIIVLCIFIKQYSFYSIISSIVLGAPTAGIILFSLLFLAFSKVTLVATVLANSLSLMTKFMISFCEGISDKEGALISLNYPFIIIIASLLFAALLYSMIAKSKGILHSLIPYLIVLVLFFSAVSLYNSSGKDSVQVNYVNSSTQCDMLVITNNVGGAVICDIGGAGKTSYNLALNSLHEERATEIQAVILTRYSNYSVSALSSLFSSEKVRTLYIPYPETSDDYYHTEKLYHVASKYGVDVYAYEHGKTIEVFESTVILIDSLSIKRSVKPITMVSVNSGKERLTYCSGAFAECDDYQEITKRLSDSRYVVFGDTGPKLKSQYFIPDNDKTEFVIFSNEEQASYFRANGLGGIDYRIATESCRITLSK